MQRPASSCGARRSLKGDCSMPDRDVRSLRDLSGISMRKSSPDVPLALTRSGNSCSSTYISPLSRSASCSASSGDLHNIAEYPCLELDRACNCLAVVSETTRIVAPIPDSTAAAIIWLITSCTFSSAGSNSQTSEMAINPGLSLFAS
jgi:hypothetical protein